METAIFDSVSGGNPTTPEAEIRGERSCDNKRAVDEDDRRQLIGQSDEIRR